MSDRGRSQCTLTWDNSPQYKEHWDVGVPGPSNAFSQYMDEAALGQRIPWDIPVHIALGPDSGSTGTAYFSRSQSMVHWDPTGRWGVALGLT